MFANAKPEQKQKSKSAIQKKEPEKTPSAPNQTGIPDAMKSRFENLSGFSFDDVRVHYNSDKPAQLQALAYTQGNQVYVGPGQETHLGHELGHVVQQKEGRVQPTIQLHGVSINDSESLESEADMMGNRSAHGKHGHYSIAQVMSNIVQRDKIIAPTVYYGAETAHRGPYLESKDISKKTSHITVDSLNSAIGFTTIMGNFPPGSKRAFVHNVLTVSSDAGLSADEKAWKDWLREPRRKEALMMEDMTAERCLSDNGIQIEITPTKTIDRIFAFLFKRPNKKIEMNVEPVQQKIIPGGIPNRAKALENIARIRAACLVAQQHADEAKETSERFALEQLALMQMMSEDNQTGIEFDAGLEATYLKATNGLNAMVTALCDAVSKLETMGWSDRGPDNIVVLAARLRQAAQAQSLVSVKNLITNILTATEELENEVKPLQSLTELFDEQQELCWQEEPYDVNLPKDKVPETQNIALKQEEYSSYLSYMECPDHNTGVGNLRTLHKVKDKNPGVKKLLDVTETWIRNVLAARFWRFTSLMGMDFLREIGRKIEFVRKADETDDRAVGRAKTITASEWSHAERQGMIADHSVERIDPVP